jgi:hypothetical protein
MTKRKTDARRTTNPAETAARVALLRELWGTLMTTGEIIIEVNKLPGGTWKAGYLRHVSSKAKMKRSSAFLKQMGAATFTEGEAEPQAVDVSDLHPEAIPYADALGWADCNRVDIPDENDVDGTMEIINAARARHYLGPWFVERRAIEWRKAA